MQYSNWIRIDISDENDAIIDLIDDTDLYEDIVNDEDQYYLVDPEAWKKASLERSKGRDKKKEEKEQFRRNQICRENTLKAADCKKVGDIEGAIKLYEICIATGAPILVPYIDLSNIYKTQKDSINELRVCKTAIAVFPGSTRFSKRIRELEGTQPSIIVPQSRMRVNASGQLFGDILFEWWNGIGKEDIYIDEIENDDLFQEEEKLFDILEQESDYIGVEYKPNLKIDSKFHEDIDSFYKKIHYAGIEADHLKATNDYIGALHIYERLLSERYPFYYYYESLRAIYQKFRLRSAELELLEELIEFLNHDLDRYKSIVIKIAGWFPESNFSIDYPYINGLCIYENKRCESQIKKWKERIVWLKSRLS